jgi:hypothetical protein
MDARRRASFVVERHERKAHHAIPLARCPVRRPRPGRATDYPPRRERASDRHPRALLAAPAFAVTAWLGVITVAIVDEDSSRADRSAAQRDATVEGPSARPGSAGPGIAPLPRRL